MRIDLQSHPKIVRILSATGADKFRVIGGLHAVWSIFDTHSTNGELPGYTPELMDHVIGWPGFSDAMITVGWLIFDGVDNLLMPDFVEHNGKSAKRRAEDQKRKREARNPSAFCPQASGQKSEKKRTREREEKDIKTPIVPFGDFWDLYPRKQSKAAAEKAWKKLKPTPKLAATIIDALKRQCESEQWQKDGGAFIPHASTWLNNRRWEDDVMMSTSGDKPRDLVYIS